MGLKAKFEYDASTAINQGRRDRQEDAIASDFMAGSGLGFAVLADGMGGHAAGDIASKIVVTEVFSELKFRADEPEVLEDQISEALSSAAFSANECVGQYADHHAGTGGMGATLLAPVIFQDRLYWISIGDSPLYLFRDEQLMRLNDEHSLASQLDELVAQGHMGSDEAENHPDRGCLTSVLTGREISLIDCKSDPVSLKDGDIVIAASDGLQYLEESAIAAVLSAERPNSSTEIGSALMQSLDRLNDPEQDNISFCVIKVSSQKNPKVKAAASPASIQQVSPVPQSKGKSITIVASASRSKGITSFHIIDGGTA